MPASPSRIKLLVAFTTLYLVWGSTYLAIRYMVETLPPFLASSVRFAIAGVMMYGWCRWRGEARPTREQWRSAWIVGTLLLCCGNAAVVWAEQRVSSGLAALFVSTMPFWIVLISWIRPRGHAPTRTTLFGVLLGVSGMIYLVAPWNPEVFGEGKAFDVPGVLALIFSTITWATGSLLSKELPLPRSPFLSTAMEMLTGSVMLLLVGTLLGEWQSTQWGAVSAQSIFGWVYLLVFGSLIGFTAYIWLLKNTPPAHATTYAFVNPIIALILGGAIADEAISGRIWVSAALILTAVAMILTSKK